ncbi:GNAT family N-acetyltransferase [Azospirillum sp. B506]|uniref:GNAT family N-acetyltransferase n=1 Tax=Azospirillum sp. B506 TaxID=137721 RepID=UPI0003495022|nr:GNAT family N-acetyltransferase [Azospirillum sp. B506]
MSTSPQSSTDIRAIETDEEVAACFPLMRQLRPHLSSKEEFVSRWRRQTAAGYRLLALWQADGPTALAGFRLQDNLMHGIHFYVDDLVTDEKARSTGAGRLMMDRLKSEARRSGCTRLVLDTPLTNMLGHRFYFRHGLLARALRFSIDLDEDRA